jgi:hypothetical protein
MPSYNLAVNELQYFRSKSRRRAALPRNNQQFESFRRQLRDSLWDHSVVIKDAGHVEGVENFRSITSQGNSTSVNTNRRVLRKDSSLSRQFEGGRHKKRTKAVTTFCSFKEINGNGLFQTVLAHNCPVSRDSALSLRDSW